MSLKVYIALFSDCTPVVISRAKLGAHTRMLAREDERQLLEWIFLQTSSKVTLCRWCHTVHVVPLPRNVFRLCSGKDQLLHIVKLLTKCMVVSRKSNTWRKKRKPHLDVFDGFEGSFCRVECNGVPATSVHGVLMGARLPLTVSHTAPLNLLLQVSHLQTNHLES
jgi:hypothetical protein